MISQLTSASLRSARLPARVPACLPSFPASLQAHILQVQVKSQADKDVANYEAEWRQLTDIVEQDRRGREAQRQRDIAAREQQIAALFKQDPSAAAGGGTGTGTAGVGAAGKRGGRTMGALRMPPGSSGGGGGGGGTGAGTSGAGGDSKGTDVAAATAPERVRQLKEAFGKVLTATGEQGLPACHNNSSSLIPDGHLLMALLAAASLD